MAPSVRTILLSEDDAVAEALAEAFGEDRVLTPIAGVGSIDELEALLSLRPQGLVIVDVQPDPTGMIAALAEIIPNRPNCRFVVVAEAFDKRVLLESMQAGARHYLPKDWIGADVVPICRELAGQMDEAGTEDGPRGRVCTVLSASGGCGATTFAVNLAAELGVLAGSRSLVVDFDLRFGGVATHLGVSGEYGLADLLAREGPLDADLVRSTSVERGEWLDVLLSPASINFSDPAPLYLDELQRTLGIFRNGYASTVIDAPGLPFEATSALAGYSDSITIVLGLSVKDLRNTRLLIEGLAKAGVTTPISLFANRVKGAGKPITLKEAAETLEFDGPLRMLPDDEAGAVAALHAGESLYSVAIKSKLRKQIALFAEELHRDGDEAAPVEKKSRFGFGQKKAA